MPTSQIQVRGLPDGSTPFVLPEPIPVATEVELIKIDAGVGVDVGTFDLAALSTPDVPVWIRAFHIELAALTLASRSQFDIQGLREPQLLAPINSVASGALLLRPFVLNPNGIAPVGTILEVLTDSVGADFGGAPVAGPHFIYMDLVPLVLDNDVLLAQDMEAFSDAKRRAEGEIYESFQGVAASAAGGVGLWISPLGGDVSFNAQTGHLQLVCGVVGTPPDSGESMTIIVQKVFGAAMAVTMATITIDDAFIAGQTFEIPLTNNNIDLLTGSQIRIVRTYVAGGAPAPMADTTVRLQIVPVRDPNSGSGCTARS